MGRGGGLVVSILAFNNDNANLNPAICQQFLSLKKAKINKKRPGLSNDFKKSAE